MNQINFYVGLTSETVKGNPADLMLRLTTLLDRTLDGYTIIETQGRYEGVPEPSCIVQIIGHCAVHDIAQNIASELGQKEVLVTVVPVISYSFCADGLKK